MAVTRGDRNIQWIETYCKIPDGMYAGQSVILTEHQRKWIKDIYDSPTRRYILSMGRKNAKSVTAAFLLLLHLVGPEARAQSQLYSAAQSRDQAALVFNLAATMIRMSPDLHDCVAIRDSTKQLQCPELGTFYRALSADASTAYGLSPVFVVHDELGQVKGPTSELYDALETASAAHEAPLSVVISTQAPTDGDLLSALIDSALQNEDPRIKASIYQADKDADPFCEETIRQANPHYDVFMNQDEVRQQMNDTKRIPSKEPAYRNLILNQRVEADNPFVTATVWAENGDLPDAYEDQMVYAGLDLSSVSDLTALVLCHWRDGGWDVNPVFWLPSEGLREKSRIDKVPYWEWAEQGLLETTPGRAIEYEYVAGYLRRVFNSCRVQAIAFDRWGMNHLKPWLKKVGFNDQELERFIDFGQGFKSMSPALRDLESLLLTRKIRHGNHPVLRMCAANARIQTDPAGGRKFTKAKSSGRIDGMVAIAMAAGVMPEQPDEQGYTLKHGIVAL